MFDMAAMYDAPKCVRIGMEYFVIVTFMICVFIYTWNLKLNLFNWHLLHKLLFSSGWLDFKCSNSNVDELTYTIVSDLSPACIYVTVYM